jgi:hypothetical protein
MAVSTDAELDESIRGKMITEGMALRAAGVPANPGGFDRLARAVLAQLTTEETDYLALIYLRWACAEMTRRPPASAAGVN